MANATLTLLVDNGSPALSYFPFADTLSVPDLHGGWNPYYDLTGFASTPGQEGNGTSRHITAKDGAQFAIVNFFGTSVQLFGNISQTGTYDLQLDDQLNSSISTFSPSDPNLLAAYSGLPATNHTLSLTFHNPTRSNETQISIEHAVIIDGPIAATLGTQIIDDDEISFVGQWSFTTDTTLSSADSTFHVSSNTGDHFSFLFNGSAVALTGFHDASSGRYSVQVDSNITVFNGASSFKEATTLFFMDGLGPGTHNMTVVNQEDQQLAVGAINITTLVPLQPTPIVAASNTGLPGGSIAAIVVASVLGALVALLLGFFIWRRRQQQALRRRMFMTDNVLDSDVMDIAPDDDADVQKPPSKTSPVQREGSGRSFTLSLPMQARPSHSQRDYSGNSIQELPRSPSISLLGSQPGTAADASTNGSRLLELPQTSPFAIEFAERAVRERPRVVPSSPIDDVAPSTVQPLLTSSQAPPPTPTAPTTPADVNGSEPMQSRPWKSEDTNDSAVRETHFSFLDISSQEGSSRDGRASSVYASSSSSDRARRSRFSEQTASSHGRPISLGYAFQYHRNSDLGLFRQAKLQQTLRDATSAAPEPVPLLPANLPTLGSVPLTVVSSPTPSSAIRPLPRVPHSLSTVPLAPGSLRIADERAAARTPPILQLQTRLDIPPPPPPAHLSPDRGGAPFSAATSTGLTFAFGSNRDSSLLQPGAVARRRLSTHASPTESVPMSVSDIHFRHSSDDEPGGHVLGGREGEDHQPAVEDTPRAYASPFIMQRLRGEQAMLGSPGSPRLLGSPLTSRQTGTPTSTRPSDRADLVTVPLPRPFFAPGIDNPQSSS